MDAHSPIIILVRGHYILPFPLLFCLRIEFIAALILEYPRYDFEYFFEYSIVLVENNNSRLAVAPSEIAQ